MKWKMLIDGGHGLYLTCECGWKADVDPATIKATDTWLVPDVIKELPCRRCKKKGLEMTITSPKGLGMAQKTG